MKQKISLNFRIKGQKIKVYTTARIEIALLRLPHNMELKKAVYKLSDDEKEKVIDIKREPKSFHLGYLVTPKVVHDKITGQEKSKICENLIRHWKENFPGDEPYINWNESQKKLIDFALKMKLVRAPKSFSMPIVTSIESASITAPATKEILSLITTAREVF